MNLRVHKASSQRPWREAIHDSEFTMITKHPLLHTLLSLSLSVPLSIYFSPPLTSWLINSLSFTPWTIDSTLPKSVLCTAWKYCPLKWTQWSVPYAVHVFTVVPFVIIQDVQLLRAGPGCKRTWLIIAIVHRRGQIEL